MAPARIALKNVLFATDFSPNSNAALPYAMSVADRAYCFQEGRVSLTGRPQELSRDAIHAAYFGL